MKIKQKEVSEDVIELVSKYVYDNYKTYKDMPLIITQTDNLFLIRKNRNGSILFLSKSIL